MYRFPAYSAPEVVEGADAHHDISFSADIWSLSACLFQMVSGQLPFDGSTKSMTRKIRDPEEKAPDVREKAPAHLSNTISSEFAAILSKGLRKVPAERFSTAADMATALHHCLVQQGKDVYSVFISYYELSQLDKLCAVLLHSLLDKTRTKKGFVVRVSMRPSILDHGQHWTGYNLGLQSSLMAIPILSTGICDSLRKLKGSDDDQQNNVLEEIILMQTLKQNSIGKLKKIFPITINKISSSIEKQFVPRTSPPISHVVRSFFKQNSFELPDNSCVCSVREHMVEVLKMQGAELWKKEPGNEIYDEKFELGEEFNQFVSPQGPFTSEEVLALKQKLIMVVGDICAAIDNLY
jgi:serine/threonine protein kinase